MSERVAASTTPSQGPALVVGRYELAAELARGGMATVYLTRLRGDGGLQRIVAVKRMHAQLRDDDDMAAQFLDEARLALRVRHPNVLHALDVILHEGELLLVMEYIEGASLSQLLRLADAKGLPPTPAIASGIMAQSLHGLHAAHETRGQGGEPLSIVHRDISPHNLLVGSDGVPRVVDFGVAKAAGQAHVTRSGVVQGKLAYLSPEQLLAKSVDRRADIFAAGIVLWEMLTAHRLFFGKGDGQIVLAVLESAIPAPSTLNPAVSEALDAVVMKALDRSVENRYPTAEAMAVALERAVAPASTNEIGAWVREVARDVLAKRAELVAQVESTPLWTEAPSDSTTRGVSLLPGRKRGIVTVLGALLVAGLGYGARGALVERPREAPRARASDDAPLGFEAVRPVGASAPQATGDVGTVDGGAATAASPPPRPGAVPTGAVPTGAVVPSGAARPVTARPDASRPPRPSTAPPRPPLYSRD
jgi:serine/threonine-protein kinase